MSIPNFTSIDHQREFVDIFATKAAQYSQLMSISRDYLFPNHQGRGWEHYDGRTMEVIRDMTQSILYDVEYSFKSIHPEYKEDDDEMFIPRRTFKEDVAEALLEANQKFWNSANEDV